jgi:hypothetical protein
MNFKLVFLNGDLQE